MAQRNIISQYDARTRRQIAVWLADGIGPQEIRKRLAASGVTPLPHNTSFAAYQKSPEYRRIYDRQLELSSEVAAAETDWRIAESAGANGYAATCVFEVLRDLRREYVESKLIGEKVRIAETINGISRTFAGGEAEKLKEADRSWKRKFHDQEAKWKRKLAESREQWKHEQAARVAKVQEELSGSGRKTVGTAEVAAKLKELLGA